MNKRLNKQLKLNKKNATIEKTTEVEQMDVDIAGL